MFDPGRPFQPSLMFAGKVDAYPNGASISFSPLVEALVLTWKQETRMEKLDGGNYKNE